MFSERKGALYVFVALFRSDRAGHAVGVQLVEVRGPSLCGCLCCARGCVHVCVSQKTFFHQCSPKVLGPLDGRSEKRNSTAVQRFCVACVRQTACVIAKHFYLVRFERNRKSKTGPPRIRETGLLRGLKAVI